MSENSELPCGVETYLEKFDPDVLDAILYLKSRGFTAEEYARAEAALQVRNGGRYESEPGFDCGPQCESTPPE